MELSYIFLQKVFLMFQERYIENRGIIGILTYLKLKSDSEAEPQKQTKYLL